MSDDTLSGQVLATARAMNASGINRGSSGNVSARTNDGFIVTPTGIGYDECAPQDMVHVGMDETLHGTRKPSSEWRIHRDIYLSRSDVQAVIHTHPPFATSLACMEVEIPAFHYMVARFGGNTVPCAPYATFGTQELSDAIVVTLVDRNACLMAHHGMVVCGRSLSHALQLTTELEALCEQYWRVLLLGKPRLIDNEEMQRVLEKFRSYGQQ